jgi:hypothetical protein
MKGTQVSAHPPPAVQAEDHLVTRLRVHVEKGNAVDAGNAAVDFDVICQITVSPAVEPV